MTKKHYAARIDKPVNHITSKGVSYVTPFDVIRSKDGQETLKRHSEISKAIRESVDNEAIKRSQAK